MSLLIKDVDKRKINCHVIDKKVQYIKNLFRALMFSTVFTK